MRNDSVEKKVNPINPFENLRKKQIRKENEKVENEYLTYDSPEERAEVDEFMSNIQSVDVDMTAFQEKGQYWLMGNEDKVEGERLNEFNRIYQRRMMMMCVMPLARGVNAQNVVQSAGMAVGMAIADKKFRESLNRTYADYQRSKLGGGDKYKMFEKDNPKMVQRIEHHLAKSNGGRIPYTEQSAAAANIAMAKQAYEMMREPGVDSDDVDKRYQDSRQMLYDLAQADGIDSKQLNEATRIMYGRIQNYHPELAYIFKESAYNEVVMGDIENETYIVKTDDGRAVTKERNVWKGNYVDLDKQQEFEGMFTIRREMELKNFKESIDKDLDGHLEHVSPENFGQVANSFIVAMSGHAGYSRGFGSPESKEAREGLSDMSKATGEWDDRMAEHYADYFEMGKIDGLPESNDFDASVHVDHARKVADEYWRRGDDSHYGMEQMATITFMEAVNKYKERSPEHFKAAQEWSKTFATQGFAYQKTDFYKKSDFSKNVKMSQSSQGPSGPSTKKDESSKTTRRKPRMPQGFENVDDYEFGD